MSKVLKEGAHGDSTSATVSIITASPNTVISSLVLTPDYYKSVLKHKATNKISNTLRAFEIISTMKKYNYPYHPLEDEDLNTAKTSKSDNGINNNLIWLNEDLNTATTTASHNVTNNTLIWLDEEALNPTSHDTNLTIAMFESIADINYKLYNNLEIFLEEIGSMPKITKLIVITSGSFAENLLPKLSLSLLRELSSIFIFCKDSTNCQYLLTECRKIMDICTDEQSLKESIENELHPSTDFLLMDRNLQPIFS
ncbi:unnamed protein product, partial [Adineta steineri]